MDFLIILLVLALFFLQTHAIIFNITNNCSYTVWAASTPGGGLRLDRGQTWINNLPNPKIVKIWARTNCTFNTTGHGKCQTGDCDGRLECQIQSHVTPPRTLAEYILNPFVHKNYYRVSLLEGYNVPMEFTPTSNGCTRPINCTSTDITSQCPKELKTTDGCNNPCMVHKTSDYCCESGACKPTNSSQFFKLKCPDAFTYPGDDQTGTFTCESMSTGYRVVFCP